MIRPIVQVSDVAPKHLVKHWGHFFFQKQTYSYMYSFAFLCNFKHSSSWSEIYSEMKKFRRPYHYNTCIWLHVHNFKINYRRGKLWSTFLSSQFSPNLYSSLFGRTIRTRRFILPLLLRTIKKNYFRMLLKYLIWACILCSYYTMHVKNDLLFCKYKKNRLP